VTAAFSELSFHLEGPDSSVVVLDQALFYWDRDGVRFGVPKGFRTDLASVPFWLRSISSSWIRTARAGVLHDCAYRWSERWIMSRSECDDLYYEALRTDKLNRVRSYLQWVAIRAFGWKPWARWRETPENQKGAPPGPPRSARDAEAGSERHIPQRSKRSSPP